ncbi:SDR family NAD(P)-dependent oxidoreductase [Clostridium sp. AWRP]|nr:SDR family NAD(P)-dependent oxidoreductase [Clostridium sp. AWRP]
MIEFKDKVAVVTGAASGIGLAIAKRCASEGMKIVLADIEEDSLIKAEEELRVFKADLLLVVCDVSKEKDIQLLSKKTIEAFGKIDLLFNNAGVSTGGLLWQNSEADWKWVLGVNLFGVINSIKTFIPIMMKQNNECHIINTSSIAGLTSAPGNSIYGVSKHGIINISETLYYELKLARAKIDVAVVCPSFVKTRLIDAERNRPEEFKSPESVQSQQKEMINQVFNKGVLNGISPEKVSEKIFEGIRNKKFYIFTDDDCKAIIKQRMEDILNEKSPTIYF